MRLVVNISVLLLPFWVAASAWPGIVVPWGGGVWGASINESTTPSARNTHESDASCKDAHAVLRQYLQEQKTDRRDFKIQGWRWHTMSLIREAERLERALRRRIPNTSFVKGDYQTVVDYIVDFNMRGLHKIQDNLFFPWIREQISALAPKSVSVAFGVVMNQLESQRNDLELLGKELKLAVSKTKIDVVHTQSTTAQIVETAKAMLETEDQLLVPLVAYFVPVSSQTSFNNKVIRSLGIWDSRLHLVGMYEAVWALPENKSERQVFEEEIPYLPRMMIPRWKRTLYDPKVSVLVESEGR